MNRPSLWFTFYDAATDDLLAYGTASDCARAFGCSYGTINSRISRVKHGYIKKYTIVREDLTNGTYEVYNSKPSPGGKVTRAKPGSDEGSP